MSNDEAVVMIKTVMAKEPDLNSNGFGPSPLSKDWDMERWRADMLTDHSVGEFKRAMEWLEQAERLKHPNRGHGSYGFKHKVERWHEKRRPGEDNYVSNGMFIAACIASGVVIKRDRTGPNCGVALSWRRDGDE